MDKNEISKKIKLILLTLISVIFMGICVSVLNIIDWGMDSYTYMNVNIAAKLGWTLGNWQLLFNILMFIPVLLWGRKYIGLGTIFNMVLVGYMADFGAWLWQKVNLAAFLESLPIRIIIMLITLVIFIFSVAIYMSTNLGASPFDSLPMMISERFPKVSFKIIRFLWDLTATAIGFCLSGKIGIVTILMVLFLGQTITFVRTKMTKLVGE